ncbi:MAG TPA: hypothetical protein VI503_07525 [Gaiellaceae bacterium]|nr:hypothetical protein [Gaiellaceae bacterium]
MGRVGWTVVALGALALLAGGGVVAWVLLSDSGSEPASVADAVAAFREATAGRSPEETPVPEGVYVYETEGSERNDALTGVTHRYPERSTITVTRDECGVQMRWDVLEDRSTTWTFCVTAEGWTLESQDERHTFFGRTERTTYTCARSVLRPAGDPPGAELESTCSTGPVEERSTLRVVGHETLPAGSEEADTVHLRRTSSFTGATRGETTHDVWLHRETGIPVQVSMSSRTTNDSPIGEVHYEEDVVLRLTSLDPRR